MKIASQVCKAQDGLRLEASGSFRAFDGRVKNVVPEASADQRQKIYVLSLVYGHKWYVGSAFSHSVGRKTE